MLILPTLIAQLGRIEPTGPASRFNDQVTTSPLGVIKNVEFMISTGLGVITVLGSMFFIFNFVSASFDWLNSGGDSGKLKSARDKMLQSTTGLIVLVLSYTIIGVIGTLIGLDILNLETQIKPIVPIN